MRYDHSLSPSVSMRSRDAYEPSLGSQWWSQPYEPEGSAAAEGIVKQLGQPRLDPLTVLVREAAQNSWDARRPGERLVFRMELRRLGLAAPAWRRVLLPGPAPESGVNLQNSLT